jgi:hypothetical protein
MSLWQRHQIFEKNSVFLVLGILVVIAIGGLIEITPLFYLKNTIEKVDGVRPYSPLELAGRNIYVREPLLRPEDDQRIDACRAPRRKDRGGETGDRQRDGNREEHERIAR